MASPTVTVLHVNLAQACVESVLYGIFFLLATTSISLLVTRRCNNHKDTSTLSAGGTLLKSPLVIGTLLLFITVSGVSSDSRFLSISILLARSIGAPLFCACSDP